MRQPSISTHGQILPQKAGFALVAALLFIFLIVGLLVALVSLTTVELRVVDNAAKLRKARYNALSGLHQAIDTLQKNAGVDQTITATAGLLDTDPRTTKIDGVANPWMTGIWRNGHAPQEHDPSRPLVWLISGAQGTSEAPPLTPFTPLDDPASSNDITWLLRKAVGEDDALSVKARKIAIRKMNPTRSSTPDVAYTVGHYAWWASDEGVKCRANLPLPLHETAANADTVIQAKWNLSAPRRASWKMTGMKDLPMDSPDLSKVLTFAQIPLLGAPNQRTKLLASLEKHYHDLTADSLGVLSDCKEGGLKIDLSLAFEMSDEAFENDPFFSSADELFRLIPSMRDHYRTYKRVENPQSDPKLEAQPAAIKPGDSSEEALALAANTYLDAGGALPVKARFSPMAMRMAYAYSLLTSDEPPMEPGAPDRKIHLVIDPIIALWNPHNITLELDAYRVNAWVPTAHLVIEKRDPWQVERNYRIDDEVWHNRQLYRARSPGKGVPPPGKNKEWEKLARKWTLATDITLKKIFENHGSSEDSGFVMSNQSTATNSPLSMQPGEIVVFSSGENLPQLHQGGDFEFRMQQGLNTLGGMSFAKLLTQKNAKASDDDGLLRVYSDSEIRVTLEPTRDGNYKDEDPFDFIANYSNTGLDAFPTVGVSPRYREMLGYLRDNSSSSVSFVWAGTRTGQAPDFSYSARAYSGKDKSGKPLPGLSDTLKVGKHINATDKRFFALIDWRLKTEADANGFPLQMIARFDPRCAFLHQSKQGYPCTAPSYQISARKLTSGTGLMELKGDHGYWGPSNGASGEHYVPLFEIPTVPLLSLGQLQHYHAGASLPPSSLNPGYIIANSWAHPYVRRDREEETHASDGLIKDLSHQFNNRLFDRFYFSSLSPRPGEETVNGRIMDFAGGADLKPLPNPRMRRYLAPGHTVKNLLDRLTAIPNPAQTPAYRTIAANLLVEGAFNVNSTSVEAWKALLGSLDGFEIPVRDPLGTGTTLTASPGAPHARFALSNGNSAKRWRGFRSLSDKQLQALAEAVVLEVKTRGPFSSLGDFVNRRLKGDASGLSSALQSAIDRTNINQEFTALVTEQQLQLAAQQGSQNSGADWSFPYPEHCIGPIGAGAPGFLTQGDLLQALAPHLSARSDTFKVRAYGDVTHPITGKLEARAWCEAIVQRLPDYANFLKSEADKTDAAWVAPEDLQLDSNRSLGRRFRILRIRWLSPDEV